jgi:hypothetical protein
MAEPAVLLGWREWVALPELGVACIKAKLDTGARSSALHAFEIERYRRGATARVRFNVRPLQRGDTFVTCDAPIADRRRVTDSGGHSEWRFVIATPLVIGTARRRIELTLTDRGSMRFRLLLGRTALTGVLIDPRRSYIAGKPERFSRGGLDP